MVMDWNVRDVSADAVECSLGPETGGGGGAVASLGHDDG